MLVVTHLASPYQVEFFNALRNSGAIDLEVVYLHRRRANRLWQPTPIWHEHIFLDEVAGGLTEARRKIINADLAVFNYYADLRALRLIKIRARTAKPWCFWGERPGLRAPQWLGAIIRRSCLASLHTSRAPIWAIGRFAMERYRAGFGPHRAYQNIPYFSDLERFQICRHGAETKDQSRRFLFSGSLIRRKGVDLVARAFLRLAHERTDIRIKFLGEGDLRRQLAQILQPVHERVEFVGFKDWQDLPGHYSAADILCVPSRYDGWGLVVAEGLAAGLPVIATTRMGAAVELITTGRNGWLIPADDESALYAAMYQAAAQPRAALDAMSRHARASVGEHSLQHGVTRFLDAANAAITTSPQ